MTNDDIKWDVPGRGSWLLQGGLLPLKPGNTDRFGYYRAPATGEVMIGRPGAKWPNSTYSERAVHLGVRALQQALRVPVDGLLGKQTGDAIRAFQEAQGREVLGAADGIAGPRTTLALFRPLIRLVALAHSVPVDVLGGLSRLESSMDPACVGAYNGRDSGLCQINLGAHEVTPEQAFDPAYALNWSAEDLREVYLRWVGKTTADPWDIAIANHNSPALAQQWARTGKPPFSQARKDNGFPQINEYVAEVRSNGEVFK